MEKLIIENFLILENIEINVNKINIIIGPQASGKSLIAKLLYFFRDFLSSTYKNSIKELQYKKDIEKLGLSKFERFFPKYTWKEQAFKIVYQIDNYEVSITNSQTKLIKLDYSDTLVALHRKAKYAYKRIHREASKKHSLEALFIDPLEYVLKQKSSNISSNCFGYSLFIPASRVFFANLQKNIFSFLSSNIDIDPFISDFGSQYELSKSLYFTDGTKEYGEHAILFKKIKEIVEKILVGKYVQQNDKDWIKHLGKSVNLLNASSGQQEALPMLIILSVWPFLRDKQSTFFIEEPEAHLFPTSQKHIVSLMALIHNQFDDNLVITTHSPYILTAFNNLLLAKDVLRNKSTTDVKKIIDPELGIDFENVSAYTINEGKLTNLMNKELRIIGSGVIDSVSDEFDNVFDSLLALQVS